MKKTISFLIAIVFLLSSLMMLSACDNEKSLHCPFCNAENNSTSTHCVSCGKSLRADADTTDTTDTTDDDKEDDHVVPKNLVLLKSQHEDGIDLTYQMAAFIVWQNMYQSAYIDYFYTMYGLYEDTGGILNTYQSADAYGLAVAQKETKENLRNGIDTIAAYLEELVAGSDMAITMGLKLDKNDDASVEEVVDFMKNLHTKYNTTGFFKFFLSKYVGHGVTEEDIREAATLMAMYTKYCDYTKFVKDTESRLDKNDESILLDYVARNPSGHYEARYYSYQTTDKNLAEQLEKASDVSAFIAMLPESDPHPTKSGTLRYPDSCAEGSFEEWLCEADVTEGKITTRTFKRVANDTKTFEVKDEAGALLGYEVYIVDQPMSLTQEDDVTVYGGYLKFNEKADADAALAKIKNLKGFHLWNSFRALRTTDANNSGTVDATLLTNIEMIDISDGALKTWLFDSARRADDLAIIESTDENAFYIAYFKSTEKEWTRSARDEWIAEELQNDLEALVKDGGYAFDQTVLDTIK